MEKIYDVVIVGAGPSGLFAAYELISSNKNLKVLIIDKGRDFEGQKCFVDSDHVCKGCTPCNIITGLGGSTFLFGAKLSSFPAGSALSDFAGGYQNATKLSEYVEKIFLQFGDIDQYNDPSSTIISNLKREFNDVGLEYKHYKSHIIAANEMHRVVLKLKEYLINNNVNFLFGTEVIKIDRRSEIIVHCKDREFVSKYVILAVGRSGAARLQNFAINGGYDKTYNPVDIGLRFEMPKEVFDKVFGVHNDLKLKYKLANGEEIRSFCMCYEGYMSIMNFGKYKLLDGHVMVDKKTDNVNFALLYRMNLNEDINSLEYIDKMASLFSCFGGKNPIVMKMKDFMDGTFSYFNLQESEVKSSLPNSEVADINQIMPEKVIRGIREMLTKMDKVLPGILGDNNLVYGLAMDLIWDQYTLNNDFESSVDNIYIVGDVSGHVRGILQGGMTGVLAARGILRKGV